MRDPASGRVRDCSNQNHCSDFAHAGYTVPEWIDWFDNAIGKLSEENKKLRQENADLHKEHERIHAKLGELSDEMTTLKRSPDPERWR